MIGCNAMNSPLIRPASPADFPVIYDLFCEEIERGETYAYTLDETTEEWAYQWWMGLKHYCYIVELEGTFAGTCVIRPVKPGRGDHVGNMSFLISPWARGKGVGKALGAFALAEAKRLGFEAMQYNYVVSTNQAAVKLWQSLGFEIIGSVPAAFRHVSGEKVPVLIMHRNL